MDGMRTRDPSPHSRRLEVERVVEDVVHGGVGVAKTRTVLM
jgi:hypothetical protein